MRFLILIFIFFTQFSAAAVLPNANTAATPTITQDVSASSNLPTIYPPDIAAIIKRGTLIVAILNKDVPPFFYLDKNGNLTGFDILLAENLAQQLGVKVQFHRGGDTFDGVIDEVTKGHADIAISDLSITLPRALRINFSDPYLIVPKALAYNRLLAAQQQFRNPAMDIVKNSNITVGILAKSAYVDYVKQDYPQAKIILYADINQAMQDVKSSKIFGFYSDKLEILHWLKNNPGTNLEINYTVLTNKNDPLGVAVPWEDERLLHWINLYLLIIRQNGFEASLQKQFFE